MSDVALAFGLAALPLTLLALTNWRYALLAAIFAGFVQDPIRKVMSGQPVEMVVFCALALGFALLGAMARHGMVNLKPMAGNNRRTRTVLRLFLFYVVLQAGLALLRFNSLMVPVIGMLAYLMPIPALWLAYNYVRDVADIRRFLRVYVVLGLLVSVGIYLSAAGWHSSLLDPVGGDRLIFDRVAGIVEAHGGFMRTAEIGAWHAAAVACMLVILAVAIGGALTRLLTPVAVLYALYAAVLTGRRKVLAVMLMFICIYGLGLYYFSRRSSRRGVAVMVLIAVFLVLGGIAMAPELAGMSPHMARSSTVLTDAWDRLSSLGLASISWGLQAGGFFGLGTGAGAQGTQHFGDGAAITVGGAAEGGLGKITAELGLPGLVLAIACAWLVARQVRRAVAAAAQSGDPVLLRLTLGLLAFVAANVPVFVGASQVYGDPFVLILLGSVLGFVLAAPRVVMLRTVRSALREHHSLDPMRALPDGSLAASGGFDSLPSARR